MKFFLNLIFIFVNTLAKKNMLGCGWKIMILNIAILGYFEGNVERFGLVGNDSLSRFY